MLCSFSLPARNVSFEYIGSAKIRTYSFDGRGEAQSMDSVRDVSRRNSSERRCPPEETRLDDLGEARLEERVASAPAETRFDHNDCNKRTSFRRLTMVGYGLVSWLYVR